MAEIGNNTKMANWFKRHKILSVIIGLIVLGIIVGSGHGSGGVTTTPTTASTTNTNASPAPSKQTAKVGDTIAVGGDKGLSVTLAQIIDPAQSDNQYLSADAGTRLIGVKLVVTNKGSSSFQDSANNDVTLIGSDNQSYTASYKGITGCTNFSNGQFTLASGSSATGCVVFQLPNAVTSAKVQFAPNSGLSGDTGEWIVQ